MNKNTKVFLGDKQLKVEKVRKPMSNKVFTLLVLAVLGLIALYMFFPRTNTVEVTKEVEVVKEVDNLSVKVSQIKNDILDTLTECESKGSKEEDGLIIFDSNAKASIGQLQFQKLTVVRYYKALYNKDITGKEAILIALDYPKARQLASDIIFGNDSKGINNWYNCKVKHGLQDDVDWVKKLSK